MIPEGNPRIRDVLRALLSFGGSNLVEPDALRLRKVKTSNNSTNSNTRYCWLESLDRELFVWFQSEDKLEKLEVRRKARIEKFELDEGSQPCHPPFRIADARALPAAHPQ